MQSADESIRIEAPAAIVWEIVHNRPAESVQWATSLKSNEVVGGGELAVGKKLRQVVSLPGGKTIELEMLHHVFDKARECSGIFSKGPLQGDWAWTYESPDKNTTVLRYTMEVKAGGALRLLEPVIAQGLAHETRQNLDRLREFAEAEAHAASR